MATPRTRICAPDGACSACLDDGQCATPAPVCDLGAHECRGCAADDECASGICLGAVGECADAADVAHVATSGTDLGNCPLSAPCRTIGYAMAASAHQPPVVRIVGSTYASPETAITSDVYLKGSGADITSTIPSGAGGSILTFHGPLTATIEGGELLAPSSLVEPIGIQTGTIVLWDAGVRASQGAPAISVVAGSNFGWSAADSRGWSPAARRSFRSSVGPGEHAHTGDGLYGRHHSEHRGDPPGRRTSDQHHSGIVRIQNVLFVSGDRGGGITISEPLAVAMSASFNTRFGQ